MLTFSFLICTTCIFLLVSLFEYYQAKILVDKENDPNASGIGELCIRSPSLFKEYWKRHEVIQLIVFANCIFFINEMAKIKEY